MGVTWDIREGKPVALSCGTWEWKEIRATLKGTVRRGEKERENMNGTVGC